MSSIKYSLLTLRPSKASEINQFWDFRVVEITNQLKLYILFRLLSFGYALALAAYYQETYYRDLMITKAVALALSILIWVFSKKFDKGYVYLWPVYYLILNSMLLYIFDENFLEDGLDHGHWTMRAHTRLQFNAIVQLTQYMIMLIFFTPSMFFAMFIYTPMFIGMRFAFLSKQAESDDSHEFSFALLI